MGKAPLGLSGLLVVEVKLLLVTIQPTITFILLTHVPAYRGFVHSNSAHTVAHRPEMQTRHSTLSHQLSMDTYCTFTFQKTDGISHAVLRRYRQNHVDVIRHRVTFQ